MLMFQTAAFIANNDVFVKNTACFITFYKL